jgi:hypothetical protein
MGRLTLKQTKRLLASLDLLLILAVAGIVAWALHPPGVKQPPSLPDSSRSSAQGQAAQAAGPLSPYVTLAQRNYRKPLYDPVVKVEAPAPKPKPKFPGVLTGTVIEPGFSYATFRVAGRDELVQVGRPIGQTGATLISVAKGSVVIDWADEQVSLSVGAQP